MLSDTTVITTGQGKLYVAGILDLYGDMPVGIAMSTRNDKKLVMDAFDDMIMRGCGKPGCIIHSDRGSTYCATEYRQLISKHDFLCSMSRKGDCWDNAPMESFWGKMKSEWLSDKYDTIQQAKRDVYEYVWHFYPKERPHETFGYLTPNEFYRQGKTRFDTLLLWVHLNLTVILGICRQKIAEKPLILPRTVVRQWSFGTGRPLSDSLAGQPVNPVHGIPGSSRATHCATI